MLVKFLKSNGGYNADEIADFSEELGKKLVETGLAEAVAPPAKPKGKKPEEATF